MEKATKHSGSLYLVATPIGNLEDITLRGLRVLREVALIAAEDTRHTQQLLTAYGITARLTSYREQNHATATRRILEVINAGMNVALVTDAGTPGLSDPGATLVAEVVRLGFNVIPVPGPSAVIAALTASGLPTDRFLFLGFLPRKTGTLRKLLDEVSKEISTLVIYESPHRISKTLSLLAEVLGSRRAVVVRELTKQHETFDRGTLPELAQRYQEGGLGEMTLVIEGAYKSTPAVTHELKELVALLKEAALPAGEIARLLGPLTGLDRRSVYQLAIGHPDEPPKSEGAPMKTPETF
jgi:16S rRNA (cytidine1402-2'-O)-methyltransferase